MPHIPVKFGSVSEMLSVMRRFGGMLAGDAEPPARRSHPSLMSDTGLRGPAGICEQSGSAPEPNNTVHVFDSSASIIYTGAEKMRDRREREKKVNVTF